MVDVSPFGLPLPVADLTFQGIVLNAVDTYATYIQTHAALWSQRVNTHYYSNFLRSRAFEKSAAVFQRDHNYRISLLPVLRTVSVADAYSELVQQQHVFVGSAGLLQVQEFLLATFPRECSVVSLDAHNVLPRDASGNHRLAWVRYFVHPRDGTPMWQFGATFWELDLRMGQCLLLVTEID